MADRSSAKLKQISTEAVVDHGAMLDEVLRKGLVDFFFHLYSSNSLAWIHSGARERELYWICTVGWSRGVEWLCSKTSLGHLNLKRGIFGIWNEESAQLQPN